VKRLPYVSLVVLALVLYGLVPGNSCAISAGKAEPNEKAAVKKDPKPDAAAPSKAVPGKPGERASAEPNRPALDKTFSILRQIASSQDKPTKDTQKKQPPNEKAADRSITVTGSPQKPAAADPNQVALRETYTVSGTYPSGAEPVVRLDKTVPRTVEVNEAFAYSIKVTNLTDIPITNVLITEYLSENFRVVGTKPAACSEEGRLLWQIGVLAPKAAIQVAVAGLAERTESLGHYTALTYVIPVLSVVEVVHSKLEFAMMTATDVSLCDSIPVEFTLENVGTAPLEKIRITDVLPEGLRTSDGKPQLVIDAGALKPGQSRRFSAELAATKTGLFTHKAVASTGSRFSVETRKVTTTVRKPELEVTNSGPARQYIGHSVTYEITVTNRSRRPAANTTVSNTVPSGVGSMKATAGAELSDSELTWRLGTLPPGTSRKLTVSYIPVREGKLSNTVTATADCADSVTASAETSVIGAPALILEVVDVNDPVPVGGKATYLVTVANQGSAAGTGVGITCILEDLIEYVSSDGPTAGSINGNRLTFAPLETLAPKSKASWRVVTTVVSAGDVRFKVSMKSDQLTRPVDDTEATQLYK